MMTNGNAQPASIPPILFADFCVLLSKLRAISPLTIERRLSPLSCRPISKEHKILCDWISGLRAAHPILPPSTGVHFFRLFFPDVGVRRRYGMKETMLSAELETLYGLRKDRLSGWDDSGDGQRNHGTSGGCLGVQLERVLGKRPGSKYPPILNLQRVDDLLDELAAHSHLSAVSVALSKNRSRSLVLAELFLGLSAEQAAFMVQIILQDLSPMLYPPVSDSGIKSLRDYNSLAYNQIDLSTAMNAWDPRMAALCRTQADLDVVAKLVEQPYLDESHYKPTTGIPIQVPKTVRPGTCSQATKNLRGLVAIETKYDGERLQIHIQRSLPRSQQIQIFSKSTRDSTQDRQRLLPIIRAALGLDFLGSESKDDLQLTDRLPLVAYNSSSRTLDSGIFEGEMIVYNERNEADDLFYKLAKVKAGISIMDSQSTTGSIDSDDDEHRSEKMSRPRLHLKIVFFDVLAVNGRSLLDDPYESRRRRLERLVLPITGYSMLAQKMLVNFDEQEQALDILRRRFAEVIADRGEGLMLKPNESTNNDTRIGQRWVKLKKDFISGCGDTQDFVIIGASWDASRGQQLLCPPSVFTTFYVGLRADEMKELDSGLSNERKPHYYVLFSTSYGLDRKQLNELNRLIRLSSSTRSFKRSSPSSKKVYDTATYTFSIATSLCPTATFSPIAVELTGAGFQKTLDSRYYDLRWPRITKYQNRSIEDALSLSQLQKVARDVMNGSTGSEVAQLNDWIWGKGTTGADVNKSIEDWATVQRQREIESWKEKLEEADHVERKEGTGLDRSGSLMMATACSSSAPFTAGRNISFALTSTASLPIVLSPVRILSLGIAPTLFEPAVSLSKATMEIDLTEDTDDDEADVIGIAAVFPLSTQLLPAPLISSSPSLVHQPRLRARTRSKSASPLHSPKCTCLHPPILLLRSTSSPIVASSTSLASLMSSAVEIHLSPTTEARNSKRARRVLRQSNSSFEGTARDRFDGHLIFSPEQVLAHRSPVADAAAIVLPDISPSSSRKPRIDARRNTRLLYEIGDCGDSNVDERYGSDRVLKRKGMMDPS